jgi:hypothetical protein
MLSLGHADPRHGKRSGQAQSAEVTGKTARPDTRAKIPGLK